MPSSLLVRVVFGLLVVATFAAFFVTQRIKRSTPVIERVFFPKFVSPNGDGRKDTVTLRFDLTDSDRVTVSIVNAAGDDVRTLVDDRFLRAGGPHRFTWDGRTDEGSVAPDGRYRLGVTLRSEGRSVTAPRELILDTTPPRPKLLAATPPNVVPGLEGRRGRVRLRYQGENNPAPTFRVWRTDKGPPREVASFFGPRFRQTAEWDGRIDSGRLAPDGVYAFSVTVEDRAGNQGSFPPALPPTREATARRTGVSVRYLMVGGPLEPVSAGRVARFELGPVERRLRWNLTRAGESKPLRRGSGGGNTLSVRIPSDARTGVYLLRVQAGGRHAVTPVAVQGNTDSKVLVVLPAITWQGLNLVDDDRDGFPDTLNDSSAVTVDRPLAGGRLPVAFEQQVQPLLRFLDRERLRYNITTDLALARQGADTLGGFTGIAFPGSERWLTEEADLALREFVNRGGKIASFGTDAFRRRVSVGPDRLSEPSAAEPVNVFGERTAEFEEEPAPMVANGDQIGLFSGTDGVFGLFTRFERSEDRLEGTEILSRAGRDPDRPAFIAYRLGRGTVVRAGSPDWAASINSAPDIGTVTDHIWALLSR